MLGTFITLNGNFLSIKTLKEIHLVQFLVSRYLIFGVSLNYPALRWTLVELSKNYYPRLNIVSFLIFQLLSKERKIQLLQIVRCHLLVKYLHTLSLTGQH